MNSEQNSDLTSRIAALELQNEKLKKAILMAIRISLLSSTGAMTRGASRQELIFNEIKEVHEEVMTTLDLEVPENG